MSVFMKRFAMTINILLFILTGVVLSKSILNQPILLAVFLLMILWAGIELYIGMFKTFKGIVISHPIIKITRMMWPLFGVFSWLDFKYDLVTITWPLWFNILLLILCLGALLLRLAAIIYLGKSFSYDIKRPEGNTLIQRGPYRIIRHPSYLGILILASFPPLIIGSIVGFIGIFFSTLIHSLFRLKVEEKILEQEFGSTFTEYKQKTFSIIPYIY